ncbi:MAG: hypothetical protein FWF41_02935 [Betaproteobacteria bacterium]|nr:hypothetical protein [Betaproteobacteria bacterium]
MAASFQPVSRIVCPGGELVVDARPYLEDEAGGSQVQLRYRYRGIELAAIEYEAYFKNLDLWFNQGSPRIYNLGLELDMSGNSKTGGRYDRGDTLYLPPSTFSQTETQSLFDCLVESGAQQQLRRDFKSAVIRSSIFLGLLKTQTGTRRNGIARLAHADAPLIGIYGRGALMVLIERSGHMWLHTGWTDNNRADSVEWGRIVTQADKAAHTRPVLQAPRYVQFDGKQRDMSLFLREREGRTGRQLQEDYNVEWQ